METKNGISASAITGEGEAGADTLAWSCFLYKLFRSLRGNSRPDRAWDRRGESAVVFLSRSRQEKKIETQKSRLLKAKRNSVRRSRRSVSLKETDALGRRFAQLWNVVYSKLRKISLTIGTRRRLVPRHRLDDVALAISTYLLKHGTGILGVRRSRQHRFLT